MSACRLARLWCGWLVELQHGRQRHTMSSPFQVNSQQRVKTQVAQFYIHVLLWNLCVYDNCMMFILMLLSYESLLSLFSGFLYIVAFTKTFWYWMASYVQGGHSPGEPGKVREFKSGQGKQGKCVLAYRQLITASIDLDTKCAKKELFTRYSCASHEVWKKKGIFLHAGSYIEHSCHENVMN